MRRAKMSYKSETRVRLGEFRKEYERNIVYLWIENERDGKKKNGVE